MAVWQFNMAHGCITVLEVRDVGRSVMLHTLLIAIKGGFRDGVNWQLQKTHLPDTWFNSAFSYLSRAEINLPGKAFPGVSNTF